MAAASGYESPVADGVIVDPAWAEPLRRSGAYGWAVWSVWRGSLPQLYQIIRTAVLAVGEADDALPRCFVEVAEHGNVERFRSPVDMREWLTPLAAVQFEGIRVAVRGRATDVDLRIVRANGEAISLEGAPGVVLEVGAPAGADVVGVRDAIARGVSRGGFRRSTEPVRWPRDGDDAHLSEDEAGYQAALARRIAKRANDLSTAYAVAAFALIAAYLAADDLFDLGPFEGARNYVFAILVVVGVARYFRRFVPDRLRQWLRTRIDDAVFPAVEMAETTPGRRLGRAATRVAAFAFAPVAGALVKRIVELVGG